MLAWAVVAGDLAAAEVKGKLKSVDAKEGAITITVNGKDRAFTISKETEITVLDLRRKYTPKDGLNDQAFRRKGIAVTITTEQKQGKEVVTKVLANTGRRG
jgi:hypothetical protein